MLIRVVDYAGNLGGGVRFTLELLQAALRRHPEAKFELVSYGPALDGYRALAEAKRLDLGFVELKPARYWRSAPPRRILGVRGTPRVLRRLGFGGTFHYVIPRGVLDGCDVVWLPWVHRHRLADSSADRVVGSFHDAIFFQFEGVLPLLPNKLLNHERETVQRWLGSSARIVVSSKATVATLTEVFGTSPERFEVVPLSGEHAKDSAVAELPAEWRWAHSPFLLCPANIFPHKNHEVLFKGAAAWGAKRPLVLTGEGTDLQRFGVGRPATLRRLAKARGLEIGDSLIPLGYVSDETYYGLLMRSWALVMPTLAEGGGSFPVYEAMVKGIPVVCSDIPVMREQLERTGGNVLWFDPHDPQDLAKKLHLLEENYPYYKEQAEQYAGELQRRSWENVADDYWRVFVSTAARGG